MRYHYRVIVIATNYNQSRFGMVGYLEAAFSCCWSLESVLFYGPRRGASAEIRNAFRYRVPRTSTNERQSICFSGANDAHSEYPGAVADCISVVDGRVG